MAINIPLLVHKITNTLKKWHIRYKMRPYLLHKAIKKADRLHKADGKRYRVFFFGYRYYAWNRQDIKERKRTGLFLSDKKIGEDFDSICFYDTQNPESYVYK